MATEQLQHDTAEKHVIPNHPRFTPAMLEHLLHTGHTPYVTTVFLEVCDTISADDADRDDETTKKATVDIPADDFASGDTYDLPHTD